MPNSIPTNNELGLFPALHLHQYMVFEYLEFESFNKRVVSDTMLLIYLSLDYLVLSCRTLLLLHFTYRSMMCCE